MLRHAARRALTLRRHAPSAAPGGRGQAVVRAAGVLGLASGCIQLSPSDAEDASAPRAAVMLRAAGPAASASASAPATTLSYGYPDTGGAVVQRARQLAADVARGAERRWETDEGRAVLRLVGLNVAVFALWKVAPASFMVRHFASSLEAMRRGRVWVTVTANFSHQSALHLAANMFLLDTFGREVAAILTPERFAVLYVAGGIASVLGSLASRRLMRNNVLSLGASGSVMAVVFTFASLFPDRKLYLLGLWEMKARDALVLWALVDTAGLLGSFGKVDFAAHISGGAFALGYYNFIREDLAREYRDRQRASWRLFGYADDDESC
jgi:membrane associated rhomboid family serine protease